MLKLLRYVFLGIFVLFQKKKKIVWLVGHGNIYYCYALFGWGDGKVKKIENICIFHVCLVERMEK